MDRAVLVALLVGVAVVVAYLVVMRVFFNESKSLDRKIDYTKMRKWKDED
ncbi:MAG TPA: hypothetical protein VFJ86_02480 [Usitatibacter sp.]|jgi:hypothetical protein|nr:hypothetical protein [Usitatibacter sp.]